MTELNNKRFNAEAAAWDSNPDVHRASESAMHSIVNRFPDLQSRGANGDEATSKGKQGGLDVLEIGCGTGLLSLRMAPHVRSLVAVDAASGMIDALKIKLQQPGMPSNLTPLALMLVDPEDPALPREEGASPEGPSKKYDLILSHLVLHHIPDLELLLRTMFGYLKPGGQIALTDFEDFGPEARAFHPEAKMDGVERHGIDRKWFEGLIRRQGFEDAKCETGWVMRKDIEKTPGAWGNKKPEDAGPDVTGEMDFPFLLCLGRKP